MRFTLPNKTASSAGFTLIEVLIIAPIVIFAISGFVALMITMIGDTLAARDQNNLSYELQDTLQRIQDDTRLTTQFLATTGTLPSPQGSDNNFTGTAAFSSSSSLLMGALTTDTNPVNINRQLVFYANQPNDCGSLETYNRPFQAKVIYYLYNGSLWRRMVIPPYNTNATVDDSTVCKVPWQRNTCSPGYTASNCKTEDTEVMKNVASFSVKYLSGPSSDVDLGASNALSANAIEVSLTGTKTIKGRTITSTGSIRGTKLNSIDVDLPLPNTPTVTGTSNSTSAIFTWALVPNATSYLISYNINGGGWTNATVDNRTTSYTVSANRNDTVSIRVTAKNSTGTSASYGSAAATIPAWTDCALKANWVNYSSPPGYASAGYTKTSNDIVVLKGLIKNGNTAGDTIICTLPEGLRPQYPLIFQNVGSDGAGRIDVWPDGNVTINSTSTSWLSLESVRFVASTAAYTWNNLSLSNGWTNFGSFYPPAVQYAVDSAGRVNVRGLVVQGNYANETLITGMPAATTPSQYLILPARGANGFNSMGIGDAGIVAKGTNPNGWLSLQTIYYPRGFSGWSNMTLQNSWSNFGSIFSTAQYTKAADGLVTIKGLIKNGAASGTLPVAQLPVGYRPKEKMLVHSISAAGNARIDIDTDGKIYPVTANTSYTALDGISFMGDQ